MKCFLLVSVLAAAAIAVSLWFAFQQDFEGDVYSGQATGAKCKGREGQHDCESDFIGSAGRALARIVLSARSHAPSL